MTVDAEPIYWFKKANTVNTPFSLNSEQIRLPLKFTPSSAVEQTCKVAETATIGKRMSLKSGADMAQLGTAIHGCIGVALTDPTAPLTLAEVNALLQRMNVKGFVEPDELLTQIEAFTHWYKTRWPEAMPYAEIPTEIEMPNKQVLQGRIDLLLKVNGGRILIDHKSNPAGSDRWEVIAQEYAGQMVAYQNAIEHASDEKVLESWLFLPLAAVGLRCCV